jgi:octaprenyl-diphosphate synthase
MVGIIDEIKPHMERFEQTLVEIDPSDFSEVNDVVKHLLTSGGKRLRPLLLLTIGKMVGYTDAHLFLACAVEMIHTATLLHDDVIDKSELRRGRPTANAEYGVPASILFGDYLYTKAFRLLLNYGNNRISDLLLNVVKLMSEGEIKQMLKSHSPNISEKVYFEVIEAKTSCLFELACDMATLSVLDQNHEYVDAGHSFGHHFGNAFQITDDIIDYRSFTEIMGKKAGDDFAEGKVTLPLIHLLENCSEDEKKVINDLLLLDHNDADQIRRGKFPQIVEMMHRYQSFEYCDAVASREIEAAKNALAVFPDSVYKNSLLSLTEQIASRKC